MAHHRLGMGEALTSMRGMPLARIFARHEARVSPEIRDAESQRRPSGMILR